ncbi:SHOCT domain-containing protein [Halorussus amylolyticus]|uniref:SHOCT domain-containing protein n=1 Tax=Halorussus amylolyticus TaxID=1126242 RepID=UPI001046D755|nr:SHOCT domain-containing protein [Halorussus amylolyticus]
MDDSHATHPTDEGDDHPVTEVVSLVVLGLGLLGLFAGFEWFWMVFVIGFAVLVPIVEILYGDDESDDETHDETTVSGVDTPNDRTESRHPRSKQDALDTLRDRYARGDLSDEAFERKLERLLETETPESAREHVGRDGSGRDESGQDGSGRDNSNSRSTEREFE